MDRLFLLIRFDYAYVQKNPRLGENFDPVFTRAKVELTPADRNALLILGQLNGKEFADFEYVNPDFHVILDPPLIL